MYSAIVGQYMGRMGGGAAMDRLRKRSEFLAAAKARKWVTPGFVLQARARDDQAPARIGFTVSKKVGNAVQRNRARRRLRALAKLLLAKYGRQGYDYVLVGRAAGLTRPFKLLLNDARAAFDRVHAQRPAVKADARSANSSSQAG